MEYKDWVLWGMFGLLWVSQVVTYIWCRNWFAFMVRQGERQRIINDNLTNIGIMQGETIKNLLTLVQRLNKTVF